MEKEILGIHHITAIAGDPLANYDFYTKTIGLRFVKKTINFDAPDTYHFYYGDETGTPGTILTFFPFVNAKRGRRGTGEINTISFSVPQKSFSYWVNRIALKGIDFDGPNKKFGYETLSLLDPDGMKLEIVADPEADKIKGWSNGEILEEHSIRKFFGVLLYLSGLSANEELINDTMGMKFISIEGKTKRYSAGGNAFIDLTEDKTAPYAIQSAGSVHHIAWRTSNDKEQIEWREKILEKGLYPTKVIDRNYFHSVYFREPGGILFEIATDQPGFMVDETKENLGTTLRLPEWLESQRERIEKILPPLKTSSLVNKKE